MNLKRLQNCLGLLALVLSPALAMAQTPVVPGAVSKLTPEQQAALEEQHKLAVMAITFGGNTEQIVIKLEPEGAPQTVANFIQNVEKGTYKGLAIHRAIPDYLVQTGDPATRSNDNRDQWGLGEEYTIPGEFKLKHKLGSVVMARRGDKVNPDRKSNGTQFYIAVGNLSGLDGQYSVFGEVVSGLDVIKRISRSVRDSNDAPIERIEIADIKVVDHKGPIVRLTNNDSAPKRRGTSKPDALKNPFEKFLDRVW